MSILKELDSHSKCTILDYYLNDTNNPKRVNTKGNDYNPVDFTTPYILNTNPVWADPQDTSNINFEERFKCTNFYNFKLDENNRPINPVGRTGLQGRGVLGKWGPNTAADPLVTRWKRGYNNTICYDIYGNRILQFVAIKRRDNGEYAIPGGMVEPGESLSVTAKREFGEEALNSMEMSDDEKIIMKEKVEKFFSDNICIYEGYVDDPRNTDNAWMVTKCFLWHDNTGEVMDNFKLQAGDDACDVKWIDYTPTSKLNLYASHSTWVEHAYKYLSKFSKM